MCSLFSFASMDRELLLCLISLLSNWAIAAPNILFIVADDYGYNDVGFHGSELETPAIDALAREGVKLENYYVQPLCTPTRAAFMTGRYPFKIGLQTSTISPAKPYGLFANLTTLADELRAVGYATHALGKWHLGFCHEDYMPLNRGFDTFHGYLNGAEHYFTHIRDPDRVSFRNFTGGFDYYTTNLQDGQFGLNWAQNKTGPTDNVDPGKSLCYSTHDLAHRAIEIVNDHPTGIEAKPLFIYLAFQAVHSPLEAPQEYVDRYNWMQHGGYKPVTAKRQLYAGMVSALDEAVGNVTKAFKAKDENEAFWRNTLLVFTTDNGGIGAGNNFPLRGRKSTLWEGGTRGVGFVHGYGIKKSGYSNHQMMHAVDWVPTLLRASTGQDPHKVSPLRLAGIDGLDVWDSLAMNKSSPRSEFVYNIEPLNLHTKVIKAGALRAGCYKLIKGAAGNGRHDPKPEPRPQSLVGLGDVTDAQLNSEDESDVNVVESTTPNGEWMFDVCNDPTEITNLYGDKSMRVIQKQLESKLEAYRQQEVPALYNTQDDDWRADPSLHGGAWAPGWCQSLGVSIDTDVVLTV